MYTVKDETERKEAVKRLIKGIEKERKRKEKIINSEYGAMMAAKKEKQQFGRWI